MLAEGLLKDSWRAGASSDYHVIAYGRGDAFEGIRLRHPFYDREVPIILGEHVTPGGGHRRRAHGAGPRPRGLHRGPALRSAGGQSGGRRRPFRGGHAAVRRRARVGGQREGHRHPQGPRCPRARGAASATATLTAGATRRRSSSAPRRSGSSAWTGTGCARRRCAKSTRYAGCRTGARPASPAWWRPVPTGASRASAPGVCPSPCSRTGALASCIRIPRDSSRRWRCAWSARAWRPGSPSTRRTCSATRRRITTRCPIPWTCGSIPG